MKSPVLFLLLSFLVVSGCAALRTPDTAPSAPDYPVDTILDAATGREVSFESMIAELETVPVVYVGETHTNEAHHEIQLRILKALQERRPGNIAVGMEMFARPYQEVLGRWVEGGLSEDAFLRKTHWYANWRHDFSLYRDLLHYIRENRIPLVALNIEFHIPSKIAAGGIDSLLPYQEKQLPQERDLTDEDHREYVRSQYERHTGHVADRYAFDDFYAAQVVWDEAMAEAVSRHGKDRSMVVFAGSGHIAQGYGIPERARRRTGLAYRSVIPREKGEPVDFSAGDYIWIMPAAQGHGFMGDAP
ncbi:MAG: ChaN family lipoprotein [Desulfosalsimonadaceae bacterium]